MVRFYQFVVCCTTAQLPHSPVVQAQEDVLPQWLSMYTLRKKGIRIYLLENQSCDIYRQTEDRHKSLHNADINHFVNSLNRYSEHGQE